MKHWTIGLLLLAFAASAALGQASVFEEAEAAVPGEAGRATLTLAFDSVGSGLLFRWSVLPRIEISASFATGTLWEPSVKVLLLRDVRPLAMALGIAVDRWSLLSSLFFGPVGMDIGRQWGARSARWGLLWFAPHPELTMGGGIEERGGRLAPTIAIRWRPGTLPGWSVAFQAGAAGPRLTIGGRR